MYLEFDQDFQNNTRKLYDKDDGEYLRLEDVDSGVSKVAIKVANFDWSVIMIITTLFLCILYVCGFALLCLKAISSLGENNNTTGRDNLIATEIGPRGDMNVNFGNINHQINTYNGDRRRSNNTLVVEWYQNPDIT